MRRLRSILLSLYILTIAIPLVIGQIELECKKYKQDICSNNLIVITERNTQLQLKSDGNDYKKLLLKDAYVKFLPIKLNETFAELKALRVLNSSLEGIERLDFEGLEEITELSLQDNLINSLKPEVFELLTNLENLNLDGNNISAVPSTIFAKNSKLQVISLERNQIVMFHDQTFKNLAELTKLYVADNKIEDLRSGTFDNCLKLMRIVISNNRLKYVPENIFRNNENLKYVERHFSNNKCIKDYEVSNKISSMEDLKKAFKENCKPPNQELIDELNEKLKKMEEKLEQTEEKLDEMKSERDDKLEEYRKCKTELDGKDAKTQAVKNEKEKVEQQLKNLKKKADEKDDKIKELENTITSLTEVTENLTKNGTDSQQELTKITKLYEALGISFKHLSSQWYNCKEEKNSTNLNLTDATEELNNSKAENGRLKDKIKELEEELTKKNKSIEENADHKEKAERRLREKDLINSILFDGYEKANATILSMSAGKCGADLTSLCGSSAKESDAALTAPAVQDFFSLDCRFGIYDYKVGGTKIDSYYSCYVANLKILNCGSKLKDISDAPRGKNVNGLTFSNTFLTEFPSAVADKFKNSKFLEISKSGFGKFEEDICSYSSDFEVIMIVSSFVGTSIKLDSCKSLKVLKIENSEISKISAGSSIDTLTNLILKKNKIEAVGRDFFGKFEKVTNIQMAGNKLVHLDGDVFDDNKALEVVNLSDNPIKVIDGDVFERNSKLAHVDVRNLGCMSRFEMTQSKIKELRKTIKEKCSKK